MVNGSLVRGFDKTLYRTQILDTEQALDVSFNSNQSMPINKWKKLPSLKKLISSIPWFDFALSRYY